MTNDLKTTFVLSVAMCRKIANLVGHCMSTEETRYYLNGVLFENVVGDDGKVALRAVATDGHRCAVLAIKAAENLVLPTVEFSRIFPAKAIAMLAKLGKKNENNTFIEFTIDDMKLHIKDFTADAAEFMCVDGTFPDYRRVIPAKPAGVIAFQAQYVGEVAKALRAVGKTGVIALCFDAPTGPFHVDVKGEDDLTLVIMPHKLI